MWCQSPPSLPKFVFRMALSFEPASLSSPLNCFAEQCVTPCEIPLTQGLVALVSPADFERLSAYKWHAVRGRRTFYAATSRNGKCIYMHRLVAGLICTNVDHRDDNGLNNQRENLRPCSRGENSRKRWTPKTESGMRGIWKKGRKFIAQIGHGGKFHYLGSFETLELARAAYDSAAREHFGAFAPGSAA